VLRGLVAGHGGGHLAALLLAAGDQGEVGCAGPGEFHRQRPAGDAGPQHHPLTLEGRQLLDCLHDPFAIIIVVPDQATVLDREVVGGADRLHSASTSPSTASINGITAAL
jgi:hypothetical protein